MTQDNDKATGASVTAAVTSDQSSDSLSEKHQALLLAEAVRQIEQAQLWALEGRPDLTTVFTNMAKLMLLEGNGKGTESEFWVDTIRSDIAITLNRPVLAVERATKALELGEVLFAQDEIMLGVARGNLGRAIALVGRPEEARKLLSQGVGGVAQASHRPPAGTDPKRAAYYREIFMEYVRSLQSLPPRPPRAG